MSLNRQELADIVGELAEILPGTFLSKINAPDRFSCQLIFKKLVLLIDLTPGRTRLHLLSKKIPAPASPPAWVMSLRKQIKGRRLTGLNMSKTDRLVRLEFAGDQQSTRVIAAELFGKRARLLLLNGNHRIVQALIGSGEAGKKHKISSGTQPPEVKSRFDPPDPETLATNKAVEAHYLELTSTTEFASRRRTMTRAVATTIKRLQRRQRNLERDMKQTLAAAILARQAEILKLHLGNVSKGQKRVQLQNPADLQAEPILIELDPARTPVENMNRMFSRARRLTAARGVVSERLTATKNELAEFSRIAKELAEASLSTQLDKLQTEIEQLSTHRPASQTGRPKGKPSRRKPYRAYRSKNGKQIFVGRSGRDNHELTTRIARGNDLWLHTRDVAGAHVVVRLNKGETVDEQTLLDAATLAAHNSPLKTDTKVEITYTFAKNVRTLKGGPPGLVTFSKGRTILVRMETQRLKRLEETRES